MACGGDVHFKPNSKVVRWVLWTLLAQVCVEGKAAPVAPQVQNAAAQESSTGKESLECALADAYCTNPDLEAARANLHQRDEAVSQAISNWRPDIVGSLSQTYSSGRRDSPPGAPPSRRRSDLQKQASVSISQSIFEGGATYFNTKAKQTGVLAGRENLVGTEQTVLSNATQAYSNVYSSEQIVALLRESEKVLQSTLDQTQARYEVGEVTRTEVAAARARLAEAMASRARAEGTLETARANFLRIVGRSPGDLAAPKMFLKLPEDRKQAIEVALRCNPNLRAAKFSEKASGYDVSSETGALLPQVSVNAEASRTLPSREYDPMRPDRTLARKDLSATFSVTVPIFRKGTTHSRVRSAERRREELRATRQGTQREVVKSVTEAWSAWISAQKAREQLVLQVEANDLALRGVREEYGLGMKSLLDVLQIEEEWRRSKINLVEATEREFLAQIAISALVGSLTARKLKLKVPYYDPAAYYRAKRDELFSLD